MGFLVLFIFIPIVLASLIAMTLISALIGRSKGQEVSLLRCGLYLTITIVLLALVSFLSWTATRGFSD